MSFLNDGMASLISLFYGFSIDLGFASYAFAIIVLTFVIKILLFPLSLKQMKSMKAMQKIQPEIQKVQKKYKNDKEKLNKAMMELYQEYNVNPAAGCLPLLVQMPILIALFNTLRNYDFQPLEHARFFWIDNLSVADPYYILPILVALATFVQSWLTTGSAGGSNAQNKMMLYFMPLMIGYISMKFPAGLCLYWVVFNVLGVFQQIIINRLPDHDKKEA